MATKSLGFTSGGVNTRPKKTSQGRGKHTKYSNTARKKYRGQGR